MTKAESSRRNHIMIFENAPEVGCTTYRSRVYKISMVRMYTLAGVLTNLRMYGSTRIPYRNVWVR